MSGCSKESNSMEFTGNMNNDINKLIPLGQVKVNNLILDISSENRERYDVIVHKIINEYELNYEYFKDKNYDEYINKLKNGATVLQHPWDYFFGLTDDEYDELYTLIVTIQNQCHLVKL